MNVLRNAKVSKVSKVSKAAKKKVSVKKVSKTLPYVIVRCASASPFAGFLASVNERHVALINARRLYHWEGAATLSELAQTGTATPSKCKWPVAVARVDLLDAVEILYSNNGARATHDAVPVWALNK